MRNTFFYIFVCGLLLMGVSSCMRNNNDTVTVSSDATLLRVYMKHDSFPGLASAKWSIEEYGKDSGLIYNVDSLPFGTLLDSVPSSFTFNHTPAWALFYASDTDSVYLSTSDTLCYSRQPRLLARSSDYTSYQTYYFHINVHQVDPNLFCWTRMADHVYTADGADQKILFFRDRFLLFVNDGFTNRLYTSADAASWSDAGVPTMLPAGCHVEQIVNFHDVLCYGDGAAFYTSEDGLTWTQSATDYAAEDMLIQTLLFEYNDLLWAVVEHSGERYLATADDDDDVFRLTSIKLDSTFPAYDFAAVTFESSSLRPRAMVLGGYSPEGELLNSRWNLDYAPTAVRDSFVYRLYNYSIARPNFTNWGGASIIYYFDRLYLFGGVTDDMVMQDSRVYESVDEGVTWTIPDSAHIHLPAAYAARWKQSVAQDDRHYIYLVGGQDNGAQYSDVYRGRLNKTIFIRQDGDK